MLSFSIRLTEIDLISSGVRKVKSTLSMEEDTGCEIFIAAIDSRSGVWCVQRGSLQQVTGHRSRWNGG